MQNYTIRPNTDQSDCSEEDLTDKDVVNIEEAMFCFLAATKTRSVFTSFSRKILDQMYPHMRNISKTWETIRPDNYQIDIRASDNVNKIVRAQFRRLGMLHQKKPPALSSSESDKPRGSRLGKRSFLKFAKGKAPQESRYNDSDSGHQSERFQESKKREKKVLNCQEDLDPQGINFLGFGKRAQAKKTKLDDLRNKNFQKNDDSEEVTIQKKKLSQAKQQIQEIKYSAMHLGFMLSDNESE